MGASLAVNQGALLLLDDSERERFDGLAAKVREIAQPSNIIPIANDEQASILNELLARAKKADKALDASRRAITDPLRRQVAEIDDLYRPLAAALKQVVDRAKVCLLDWDRAQRERARLHREAAERAQREAELREAEARAKAEAAKTPKAQQKALAEADRALQDQTLATLQKPPEVRGIATDSGSTHRTQRWVFEVSDPEAVPREYLTVDERKIRAAVAAGVREIPGVVITIEESIVARTRMI